MSPSEPSTKVVALDVVERALASYRTAGGQHEPRMRQTLQAVLEKGSFKIGDEVICQEGGLVGVIIEIHG